MTRVEYLKQWKNSNREKVRLHWRSMYFKIRNQVLEHYGSACNRCGFSDARALQLDHINNDGYKERQKDASGKHRAVVSPERLCRALLNGTRSWTDFQVLCANCNFIKEAERREVKYAQLAA